MSLNKVQLIGNLGQDPEVRTLQNDGKVVNISLATSRRWKDKNTGEQREATEWHRVVIWAERAVRYAEAYLRKGSKVYIEGALETRKWQDQSGQDRYSTEVVVRPYGGEVQGLDRPQGDGSQSGGGQGRSQGGGQQSGYQGGGGYAGAGASTSNGGNGPGYKRSDIDDEIPF